MIDSAAALRTNMRIALRIAMGLAALSLALVIVAAFGGEGVRWTSWAVPILVLTNVLVQYYEIPAKYPRAAWAYAFASVAVAVAMIVALVGGRG